MLNLPNENKAHQLLNNQSEMKERPIAPATRPQAKLKELTEVINSSELSIFLHTDF
jgi:hypothetical protein